MATQVEIANLAMTLLGAGRIASFEDAREEARSIKACFDMLRDAELRASVWSFSVKRVSLPALTDKPAFGFGLAFQLPSDCLRLVQVGHYYSMAPLGPGYVQSDDAPYTLEGRKILTDLGAPLNVRYVSKIEDTEQYDPLFNIALAAKIAETLCVDLPNFSDAKKQLATSAYEEAHMTARRINAIEQPPQTVPDDSWVISRIGP